MLSEVGNGQNCNGEEPTTETDRNGGGTDVQRAGTADCAAAPGRPL